MIKKIAVSISIFIFLTMSAVAQNQLKGQWLLVSMADENGAGVSLPEKFEIRMNFTGSALNVLSCNNISGKYSAGKTTIKITLGITTAKHCPELDKQQLFNKLLKMANKFSAKNDELFLSGKNNKSVLKFDKIVENKTVAFNGKWQLVSMKLEKEKIIELPEKPITLNINQDEIGGNGGCNSYGGSIIQTTKTVKFSDIFSTKMWCDNSPIENQYFAALGKSVNYEIKNGQLILTDAKKENTLIFKAN